MKTICFSLKIHSIFKLFMDIEVEMYLQLLKWLVYQRVLRIPLLRLLFVDMTLRGRSETTFAQRGESIRSNIVQTI